jgi:hypothetical protein
MLQLSEVQWQALLQAEAGQFVAGVCDEFLAQRPDMRDLPGRNTVLARMRDALSYATRVGFTSTPHIVRLMYLSADAAGIFAEPLIDGYLRKPGASPELRLDELDAVMRKKLQGST